MTFDHYHRGDFVTIEGDGRTLPAMVTLASANGVSLMLMFDGMIGGFVGAMPVLWHPEEHVWRALNNMPITLTRKAHDGDLDSR